MVSTSNRSRIYITLSYNFSSQQTCQWNHRDNCISDSSCGSWAMLQIVSFCLKWLLIVILLFSQGLGAPIMDRNQTPQSFKSENGFNKWSQHIADDGRQVDLNETRLRSNCEGLVLLRCKSFSFCWVLKSGLNMNFITDPVYLGISTCPCL